MYHHVGFQRIPLSMYQSHGSIISSKVKLELLGRQVEDDGGLPVGYSGGLARGVIGNLWKSDAKLRCIK